jgi:threonine/homoserine/homoserine lactone efflux protein
MTIIAILAFTMAMLLFALIPGPAMFAIFSRTLTSGFGPALGMLAGIVIADLIFILLAIAGMAVVTEALGELFIVVKIACGCYLVWLGYRMWRQPPAPPGEPGKPGKSTGAGSARNILDGLVVGLSSPKAILFYAALLPNFVDLSHIGPLDIAIMCGIVFIIPSGIGLANIAMAMRARHLFRSARAGRILQRVGGATLGGVGISIAVDR